MSSNHNPELQPPPHPDPVAAIQPSAPDFVETPEVAPLSSEKESLPIWLYLVCGFALFMAGSSFTGFGAFGLGLCDQGPGGPTLSSAQGPEVEVTDPLALGKQVYGGNCANCHQGSGMGQPGSYPPLVGSVYVLGSKERLAAILLKGLHGALTINGASFGTQVMPAQEANLTPEKIANLMTYIRGSWGNTANAVTTDEVNAAKAKFASHPGDWTEADLLKIAPNGPDPSDKKP